MVLAWTSKSCLGLADIASFVFLVLFKDGGHKSESKISSFLF